MWNVIRLASARFVQGVATTRPRGARNEERAEIYSCQQAFNCFQTSFFTLFSVYIFAPSAVQIDRPDMIVLYRWENISAIDQKPVINLVQLGKMFPRNWPCLTFRTTDTIPTPIPIRKIDDLIINIDFIIT